MKRVSTFHDVNGTVTMSLDLSALALANRELARGLLAVGEEVIARADVPDAPPFGQGLIQKGATAVWLDGEKWGGLADLPNGETTDGIVCYVGYPFPALFQEAGTINQSAKPFLTPAVLSTAQDAEAIITRNTHIERIR